MLLSDIGGFYFILSSIAAGVLSMTYNFNKSQNILALELFKTGVPLWGDKEQGRRGEMTLNPNNPTKSMTQFL